MHANSVYLGRLSVEEETFVGSEFAISEAEAYRIGVSDLAVLYG